MILSGAVAMQGMAFIVLAIVAGFVGETTTQSRDAKRAKRLGSFALLVSFISFWSAIWLNYAGL